MALTPAATLEAWALKARERGATHILVLRGADGGLFHKRVYPDEVVEEEARSRLYNQPGQHEVVEVYSLGHDLKEQLAKEKPWHLD
jgi:hypothetical protein